MKLYSVYDIIEKAVSGEEIQNYASDYRQFPLGLSYLDYNKGIQYLRKLYHNFGLNSEIIPFPADGKTVYADRHFPLAWDVDEAWAEVGELRIADYAENSYSVIPFSADSDGICEKKLTPIKDLPKEGSLESFAALICHFPSINDIQTLIDRNCPVFLRP